MQSDVNQRYLKLLGGTMKENLFIRENSNCWQRLEETIKKFKKSGSKMDISTIDELLSLYDKVSTDLSYSRTYYGNNNTTIYLNKLVGAAHDLIYTKKTSSIGRVFSFYRGEFPMLLRKNFKYFLVSALLFLSGFVFSFIYTMISEQNAGYFLPPQFIDSMGSSPGTISWDGAIMSSFIFTNNIRVGIIAFALGITFGFGSVIILVYNSFPIGCLAALYLNRGQGLAFLSLILPHGILELFAVFVCVAAGLVIGYSLVNPDSYTRKDAFLIRGKDGIKLVCGTIPLFVKAGFIEGYFTPLHISEWIKLAFSFFTLLMLIIYIIWGRLPKKA